VPNKNNDAGEKSRSLKLTLSREPGNLNGKTLKKTFKIFRAGTPEEWTLWKQDFYGICAGMSIVTGSNHNRMVCQLLSDELSRSLRVKLRILRLKPSHAHCDEALNAVAAMQVFPNNACARQKNYFRQGVWKPKALTVRDTCTRVCELNAQLLNFPN
jgi:hypothetical protein